MMRLLLLVFFSTTSLVLASGTPSPAERLTARRYHEVGRRYQMDGNLLQARFLYQQAEIFSPDDPALLNDLGVVYEALGQWDESLRHYLKATELDYQFFPAYMNLGYYYAARGHVDTAIYYFDQCVKFGDPHDPRTLRAQAQIDRLKDSSFIPTRRKLESDMKSLENEMALRGKEKGMELERQRVIRAEADFQEGVRLFEAARYDEAKIFFEVSLRENEAHQGSEEMLDRVNTMIAMNPMLKDSGLRRDPSRVLAMAEYNRGARLMRSGNREQALLAFDRALKLMPSDPYIQAVRAQAARQP